VSEKTVVIGAVIDGPIAYREFLLEPSGCIGYCPHDFMHKHNYDHTVHNVRITERPEYWLENPHIKPREGDVVLAIEGEPFKLLHPGESALVVAQKNHFIRSIEPARTCCKFEHRDKHGNVVIEYDERVCVPDAYDFAE